MDVERRREPEPLDHPALAGLRTRTENGSSLTTEAGAATTGATPAFAVRRSIATASERAAWNVTAVAERLDLSRAHIYNLINQLAIQRT